MVIDREDRCKVMQGLILVPGSTFTFSFCMNQPGLVSYRSCRLFEDHEQRIMHVEFILYEVAKIKIQKKENIKKKKR